MRSLSIIFGLLLTVVANCGDNERQSCSGTLFNDGQSTVSGCTAARVDVGTWSISTDASMPLGTYTVNLTLITDFWTDVKAGIVDVSPHDKIVLIEHQGGVVVDETLSIEFTEL